MSTSAVAAGSHQYPVGPVDKLITRLIRWQRIPVIGALAKFALKWRGTDIPAEVLTGSDPIIMHGASGTAMHITVRLGSRVAVMHGVTLGRADMWRPRTTNSPGIIVEDDVFLGAGCSVLFKESSPIRLGRGSVIGANSVLTHSIGPGEIWAGNPAKLRGIREI
jgi:serine O-acetyltransferase